MKHLLSAGQSCNRCCACEEWLPLFISKHGGMMVISRTGADLSEIEESVKTAQSSCPAGCIFFRRLK